MKIDFIKKCPLSYGNAGHLVKLLLWIKSSHAYDFDNLVLQFCMYNTNKCKMYCFTLVYKINKLWCDLRIIYNTWNKNLMYLTWWILQLNGMNNLWFQVTRKKLFCLSLSSYREYEKTIIESFLKWFKYL